MSEIAGPSSTRFVAHSGTNCRALRWGATAGRLAWVDSTEGHLLSLDRHTGSILRQAMLDSAYTLAPCRSGKLLVGLSKRLCLVDVAEWGRLRIPKLQVLSAIDVFDPRTVISDGRTDRSGNFVFGTRNISQDQRPIGSFYQYSPVHGLRRLALPTVVDASSICFSVDGRRMLFADGSGGTLYGCTYDADSGAIASIRPVIECESGVRVRDAIVDVDDGVWLAQQLPDGAGRVTHHDCNGVVGPCFQLTDSAPTGLAAGGTDLEQLFFLGGDGHVSMLPLARCGSADVPFDDITATRDKNVQYSGRNFLPHPSFL